MDEPTKDIAYEAPDIERAASAAPTEHELEYETPGAPAARDPYAALRHRGFVFFACGFFISVIGAQMETVAARYELYQTTHEEMSLGWLGLALAIPMLLLTLPAGQLADIFSRRRLMFCTQFAAAVFAAGLAALSYAGHHRPHSLAAMYGLLAMGSAAAALGRPARASLMPQLVPTADFPNAVTWNATIFETASVIGPAVGGFICARNIALAYALASAAMFTCGVLIFMLPEPPPRDPSTKPRGGWHDLVIGVRFVWRSKLMLGALTLDLFAVLLGGSVFLLPVFAEKYLHVGAMGFGILSAAPSIGAISAAMIQAHLPPAKRAGRAMLLAVAGFGVATIIFGLSRNFVLSFVMLVLTGAFDNISVVVRHTLVQLLTPDAMRGRVSAVNQMFIGSSNELGGLESGLTAAAWGATASVVGGGIGTIVVVILVAILFTRVRQLGSLADIKPENVEAAPSAS
jgi:MFS family permease